jgi:hypothetical protein
VFGSPVNAVLVNRLIFLPRRRVMVSHAFDAARWTNICVWLASLPVAHVPECLE